MPDYVIETHGINFDRPGIEVLGDIIERTWHRYRNEGEERVLYIAGEVFDALMMNLEDLGFKRWSGPIHSYDRPLDVKPLHTSNTYVEGERPVDFHLNGKRRGG